MNNNNLSQLIKQLNWPMVIFTCLVFALLIKLALWQNDRAEEKTQRLQRIEQLNQGQPLSLNDVLTLQADKVNDGINDIPVLITGHFNEQFVFLLDNQPDHGQLGYRVYQVFISDSNKLLVNLGWVKGDIDRSKLPTITPLAGNYTIKGHIREVEVGIQLQEQVFEAVQWPLRVQQIEIDKFSQLIGNKLLPFAVYLDKNERLGYKKNWQPIVMPPEKHQAYAFQWFSLAIAWLTLMIFAFFKNKKKTRKRA